LEGDAEDDELRMLVDMYGMDKRNRKTYVIRNRLELKSMMYMVGRFKSNMC